MKTALILLSILGMACAFSMKNFHRRIKAGDSEENGVFKYRPRYFLYKHAYFYPPLKRFPVQGSSDSSEENGDGDSSEEEGEEEETSNEEENNEESEGNEDQEEAEAEAENATLSGVTASYGAETTAEAASFDLAGLQLPKKTGDAESRVPKTKESDEEEEEGEEEEENENEEAEVDENEQVVNGTSANSTEVYGGNGSSGGDNGEEAEEASVTAAGAGGTTAGRRLTTVGTKTKVLPKGFQQTTPPPEAYGTTSPSIRKSSTVEYWGEYEQTGNEYNNKEYEIYDNENGEPRGDTYRAYEDEYSYYKGHGYEGYEGQDYYYHQ